MYMPYVVDFCPILGLIICNKSANSWYIKDSDNNKVRSKYIDGKDSTHVFEINDSLNSKVDELLCHKSSYNDKVVFLITKKNYEYYHSKFYEYKQKYDYVYKNTRLYILPNSFKNMWYRTHMINDEMRKNCFYLKKYFQENDICFDVFSYTIDLFYLLVKNDPNRCVLC